MEGPYVNSALVTQNEIGQITGTIRMDLLTAANVYTSQYQYNNVSRKVNPFLPAKQLSGADYISYKKGQLLAASRPNQRPPQTVIITDLQQFNESFVCPTGVSRG